MIGDGPEQIFVILPRHLAAGFCDTLDVRLHKLIERDDGRRGLLGEGLAFTSLRKLPRSIDT
jgi:hypothetical protein